MDYAFTLTGSTPLLMHADDVLQADELSAWRSDPQHASLSVAGDDRSPPWSWQTYLHHDGEHLAMPQEAIMCALRHAGAKVPVPKGVGRGTFKALTQSGLLIPASHCDLTTDGRRIELADIVAFRDQPFAKHVENVKKLGLDLSIKRATVGRSKHVRVRLKFDAWEVNGIITVLDPAITEERLVLFFNIAGSKAGLLDWRPNSKTSPGPHGIFSAEIRPAKAARKAG